MKYAQSSAVYFNHSLPYAIQDLHNIGYDGVEIWGGRPHMIPGKGNVNFKSLFNALENIDYNGFVSVELGGGDNMNPSSACKESLEFLKQVLS